jgi:hypothetical protein
VVVEDSRDLGDVDRNLYKRPHASMFDNLIGFGGWLSYTEPTLERNGMIRNLGLHGSPKKFIRIALPAVGLEPGERP